jgi:hypothetical protein
MCRIDDGERADFYLERNRKARKHHACGECERTILKGERYIYTSYGYDGTVSASKRCAHCNVAAEWLNKYCGGFLIEGIEIELEEHYHEGYREDNLVRIMIGMRRKWKTFAGDRLMRMPQILKEEAVSV